MTNKEAVKMLKAKRYCMELETSGTEGDCNEQNCDNCPYNYEQGNMGEQKQALDMAIKALEQEPCKEQEIYEKAYKEGYDKGWSDGNFIGANRWIPVSERLPEEHEWIGTKTFGTTISDNVFVTLEATNGKRFTDYTRLQNGKLSLSKQAEWDAISKGIKLIAWMPSPEPYKAESEVGK